jgi:hypothetical protein
MLRFSPETVFAGGQDGLGQSGDRLGKINPVLADITLALALVPFKVHVES